MIVAFVTTRLLGHRRAAWISIAVGWPAFLWLPRLLGRDAAPTVGDMVGLAAWLLVLAACPGRQTRKTLVPDVPTSGDAAARSRFQDARARFLRDGKDTGEFHRIADVGVGEALVDALTHHHFALSWSEPASLGQLDRGTQFETVLHHAANGDVHFSGTIFAGQHNYHGDFARD